MNNKKTIKPYVTFKTALLTDIRPSRLRVVSNVIPVFYLKDFLKSIYFQQTSSFHSSLLCANCTNNFHLSVLRISVMRYTDLTLHFFPPFSTFPHFFLKTLFLLIHFCY